ncbi:isochorismatase family protein [Robertmurraya yapensis]|uniref:Isochorismatase family protein n=1 Tax=Bacillus yapensis TaxID=2492960 RepID=A0A3S0IBA0_9BACI|nr:isochorismatase family protein [Bacillus yapensis]RTR28748.1 isochorismatase family protein [Bacillus yapensis]TKS94605.1 isochorismatase family protein [Bacillus yapensis]
MLKTNFEEIVDLTAVGGQNPKTLNDILRLAASEDIASSNKDKEKVLFVGIDLQNDFMENGELPVPNSFKDIENTTKFLYHNIEKITTIAVSLDTHSPQQIFHPSWWVDNEGKHPEPYTIISEEDIVNGKWMAVEKQEESLEYVRQLEKQGRMKLCIWTFHCIEGTFGAALEGQFSNIIHFHSVARKSPIHKIVKGKDPLSEMYGIIKPEYNKNNFVNSEFLEMLKGYDKILVAGEAKSHCVLESLRQILEHYQDDLAMTSKIFVLEDCMSSIPGFEENAEIALKEFKQLYNINIVRSNELNL